MAIETARGSDKVLAAWKARTLSGESVQQIAEELGRSPAIVEGVAVSGGESATGVRVQLRYDGDDTPMCGNDILFWLRWHLEHGTGGVLKPPRIIINGTPYPDLVQLELEFGQVGEIRA
jgi:hypothetical protein